MKTFLLVLVVLMMFVECCNIQAIRDQYVEKPSVIETSVADLIDRIKAES